MLKEQKFIFYRKANAAAKLGTPLAPRALCTVRS
jgi:hypothetical protein